LNPVSEEITALFQKPKMLQSLLMQYINIKRQSKASVSTIKSKKRAQDPD